MGGHGEFHAPKQATQEEMAAAKLDIAYRDSCAALLIPLNQCVAYFYCMDPPFFTTLYSISLYYFLFTPCRTVIGLGYVILTDAATNKCTRRLRACTRNTNTKSANTLSEY